MIQAGYKKGYMVFNVQRVADKNNRNYLKFSIADSQLNPETREWETDWWNVISYSDIPLKNKDRVVIKSINSVSARYNNEKKRVDRQMFVSLVTDEKKKDIADYTADTKPKNQTFLEDDDDDILPF